MRRVGRRGRALPCVLVLAIVVAIAASIAAGAALERRSNRAAHAARTGALRAMLWVLVPFATYVNLAHADLELDVLAGGLVAIAALGVTAVVAWWLARGPLALGARETGAAIHCSIQANTGYLGLPLAAVLFNQQELAQAIVYDATVSLATFAVGGFALGALFGDARARRGGRGERHVAVALAQAVVLRNPVLLSAAAGLLVPEALAPEVLLTPAKVAIFATLPLGFLAVGVTLADEADEGTLRIPPPLTRTVAAVVALRMLLMPALFLLVGLLFLDLPAPYPLLAAMPVGLNTLIVARATGLDLRLCASAIAWSTSIAIAAVLALSLTGVLG